MSTGTGMEVSLTASEQRGGGPHSPSKNNCGLLWIVSTGNQEGIMGWGVVSQRGGGGGEDTERKNKRQVTNREKQNMHRLAHILTAKRGKRFSPH